MKYSLPWGTLPPEARYGLTFDEPVQLFRGDKLQRLKDTKRLGILSTALAAGRHNDIFNFGIAAGTMEQLYGAVNTMNAHTSMTAQRSGETTPLFQHLLSKNLLSNLLHNQKMQLLKLLYQHQG